MDRHNLKYCADKTITDDEGNIHCVQKCIYCGKEFAYTVESKPIEYLIGKYDYVWCDKN